MAAIAITYTFTNATTADATQVNQNFTDIINGLSDGTKDISVNAGTFAGNVSISGNTTIGNASSDDLTVTASLASSIPIKTTNSYDLGATSLTFRTGYFGTSVIAPVVTAVTSVTSPLIIGGTTTTSSLTFKTTTGVGTTNADIIFQVGNNGATEAMRIVNSGRLGIGTSSPTTTLDVLKSSGDAIQIKTADSNPSRLGFGNNGSIWYLTATRTGSGSFLPMTFYTSDTERMQIDTSGNVGIGTVGTGWLDRPLVIATAVTGNGILVKGGWPLYAGGGSNLLSLQDKDNTTNLFNFDSNSNLTINKMTSAGVSALVLKTDGNGNVGIGVTPTARNNTSLQIVNGIGFPVTQVASTDVNTLDDYEEGTWTPSLGGSTTYSAQVGTYTKIGNIVYIEGHFVVTTLGTGSTSIISGLPFTVKATEPRGAISVGYFASLALSVIYIGGVFKLSDTKIEIYSTTAASASVSAAAVFGNGATIYFSGHYTV